MTLAPLLSASASIQVHVAAAVAALALTVPQLALPKGRAVHRRLGYAWAAAMLLVAASSFLIHAKRTFGPFSWIHLLSVLTLVMVPLGIARARRGQVGAHRWTMLSLVLFALLVTGLFTLWWGRIMHAVVLG